MRTDPEEMLERLFAAARSEQNNTEIAEEFFEGRLMARLRERREAQRPWYEAVWRFVPACALITALLAIGSITIGQSVSSDLFASISAGQEEYLAKSFLAGE
jgi:hypothetical protein